MRKHIIAVALLLPLGSFVSAEAPRVIPSASSRPPDVRLGDNAALRYWLAFAMMPALSTEQDEIVGNWDTAPLNGKAKEIVNSSRSSLDLLQRAREVTNCDWGLLDDGPETLMPHLAKARQLARLAGLRIRCRVAEGDEGGAVEDTLAVLALARQVSVDRLLISQLVAYAIEHVAINAAADGLRRLHPDALRRLSEGLARLPEPRNGFREGILGEQHAMIDWFIERLKAGDKRVEALIAQEVEGTRDLAGAKDATKAAQKVQNWIQELVRMRDYYSRMASLAGIPLPEFDRRIDALNQAMMKDCPNLAPALAPAMAKVRYQEARVQAHRAMLKAAIAFALDGPEGLSKIKDPFGDGPFEYREIGNGFQLKSKLLIDGASVGLTVSTQR